MRRWDWTAIAFYVVCFIVVAVAAWLALALFFARG
jgi:hypothetical protein